MMDVISVKWGFKNHRTGNLIMNVRQPDPVDYFLTANRMNRWRKFLENEDFGAKPIVIGVR